MIGRTIGNYRILEKIGSGSSGTVYRARHLTLDIPVALKFIHRAFLDDPDSRTRFHREARAAASLDHPAICKVFDFEANTDDAYIAMDLVEGVNLKEKIAAGPLAIDEAILLAIQIGEGLEAAHARDIIHRDIKPSNIMIAPRDNDRYQAKILDFGVARSSENTRVTRTGGIVGTATYMSPEQARGDKVDQRTDLWALGVCLYEMVTGEAPFKGDYQHAVQYAVIHAQPTPVGTLRPEAPPELRRIINRAMKKDPADRFGCAGEMLAELRALLREVDTDLSPVRNWLWKYRNRLVVGTGTIITLALLAWIIIPLAQRDPTPNPFTAGRTRQVTHSTSWDSQPRLSPDGKLVAFTSDAAGNLDIFWMGLAGGDPVPLTDDPADDSDPCWLPDGSGVVFASNRLDGTGIWKTDLTGRDTKLLVPGAWSPAISPDGRRLAFIKLDEEGSGRVFVADLDDPTDMVQVTREEDGYWSHFSPAWSPDSRKICYGGYHDLWELALDGDAEPRPVTTEGIGDGQPVYSRDGRMIYFASYRDGTSALWRTTLDGKEILKLTPGSGPEADPHLDREGRNLVYSTTFEDRDILMRDGQGELHDLMVGPTLDFQPALSPDGSMLAFVSNRWNRLADLWIQRLDGGVAVGEPERLVETEHSISHPAISPDNKWVAYYVIEQEKRSRDIWLAPIPAGRPVRITDDPASDTCPVWSPDGRNLAFTSEREGNKAVYTVALDEGRVVGRPVRVTPLELSTLRPTWSPDGKSIAFQASQGGFGETWIIPADGSSPPRKVTDQADTYVARWVWDRNELWANGLWGGSDFEVRRLDLAGGPALPLEPPLRMGPTLDPEFYPDRTGNMVVFTTGEMKGDIWILEAEEGVRF